MRAHSFSSISTWVQCPKKYEETYILKRWKDEGSAASRRGDVIHKELELYLKGERTERPTLEPQGGLLDMLKTVGAEAEPQLAVTRDLQPTGFWSDDAWLRGKLDAVIARMEPLTAWDWKSGKKRNNDLQADVYHVLLRGTYPKAGKIRIVFDYLEKGRQPPYQPGEGAIERVTGLTDRIEGATAFPPKPSPLCRGYCPVKNCDYYEERP